MDKNDIIIRNFDKHQNDDKYHEYTCECYGPCISKIIESVVYRICPNNKCGYMKELLSDEWIYESDLRELREYKINKLLNE